MSSMTPSAPHSFIATVPGGATRAPGGTQPTANAKISASSANKESLDIDGVIAALILAFAVTSQATRARACAAFGKKRVCSRPGLTVYFSSAASRPNHRLARMD
jgi:hypothetical protein